MEIESVILEHFKSYKDRQEVPIRKLTLMMGANSSGKSSVLQALMILKQTLECSSPEIDLLLSGKYVNVGDFNDALTDGSDGRIMIGVGSGLAEDASRDNGVFWTFNRVPKNDSEAALALVTIRSPFAITEMRRVGEKPLYQFYIDGVETQYFAKIQNLELIDIILGYNKGLNELFFQFMESLADILFSAKDRDRPDLRSSLFMPIYGISAFDMAIMTLFYKHRSSERAIEGKNTVVQLMNKFCQAISGDFSLNNSYREEIRNVLWNAIFEDEERKRSIIEICNKYDEKLDSYCANKETWSRLDGTISLDQFTILNNGEYQVDLYDKLSSAADDYKSVTGLLKNRITYLGPLRERPQGLYNIGFESLPKYVGPSGAYCASVLYHEEKQRNYLLPSFSEEETTLSEASAEWLDHLGIASSVQAEKQGSYGIRVSVNNLQNNKSDIMNVGIGTSQVLPVLISGLLSKEKDILMFEQPELHLHPLSQSRLADFFVVLAKYGRRVIVETHSEHMLLRLRYLVLDEKINHENLAVVFFQNEDGTQVKEARLDDIGGIQYPPDFRDVNEKLIEELLTKSMAKRRK